MTGLTTWCTALLLTLGSPVAAAAAASHAPFGHGTHAFRKLLNDLHLAALTEADALAADPAATVLIVLGMVDVLDRLPLKLDQFLEKGGAVLVASDRDWPPSWTLPNVLGLVLDSRFVESSRNYRNLPACPLVRDIPGSQPPLFNKLVLATNRPSFLQPLPKNRLAALARFARGSMVVPRISSPTDLPTPLPGGAVFAVGGEWGSGRILVLADHSIFINDMMLAFDNDNFEFAYQCVGWLSAGGRRTRVLFYEEGQIMPTFDVDLREAGLGPPLPPIQELLPWAFRLGRELEKEGLVGRINAALDRLEREDAIRSGLFGDISGDAWLRVGLTVASLAAAIWGLWRLSRARFRRPTKATDLAACLAASPRPVAEQRLRAMIRDDNLAEPARNLARQVLADLGHTAEAAPRVQVIGGWRQRRRLRRQLDRLWRLAWGQPTPVSRDDFTALLRQADDLRAAANHGTLRLG
ncbi:MAG: hypothetical protein NZ700_00750 [Gemmataceae bacterium]|nr:hypothetical protein [Gemmataceae bacterium]MDW8264076.1 hypothetical protein [Gemmataceae bacterium]